MEARSVTRKASSAHGRLSRSSAALSAALGTRRETRHGESCLTAARPLACSMIGALGSLRRHAARPRLQRRMTTRSGDAEYVRRMSHALAYLLLTRSALLLLGCGVSRLRCPAQLSRVSAAAADLPSQQPASASRLIRSRVLQILRGCGSSTGRLLTRRRFVDAAHRPVGYVGTGVSLVSASLV